MGTKCPQCNTENTSDSQFCKKCATPLPPSEEVSVTKTLETPIKELTRGTTFAGRYKIIEEMGRGGMGVVYKAEDIKLKRTVALKFLPPELKHISEVKERFMREAQAAAALDHPNICTVYEFDEAEKKTFISMAYIEGESLKKKIESSPLELDEALRIAIQVAEGLQEAHKKGVVHRDIKSANIMVTEKDQAKIMDFGLARIAGGTLVTKEGMTMGTIAYMSPEQARGEDVDYRTDIWSFGVVLYEMFSGQLPFKGEKDQAVVYSILNEKPKPITNLSSEIPMVIEQVVGKALKKNPEERYQQIEELLEDLRSISEGLVPEGVRARLLKVKLLRRKRTILYSGIAGCLIIMTVIALSLFTGRAEAIDSIAVLPFTMTGGDSNDQAFCNGIVEALTSKLTRLEQFQKSLWIVPAQEVRKFEITSPSKARRVFMATLAVKGSFKRIGDMVRLTLKLVDAKTLHELRSQTITDHIANISTLQDDSIFKLVEMLDIELQPQIRSLLIAGRTTIPNAYESYMQGCGYINDYKKKESLNTAISLFKRAIEQDSNYALAYARLGSAYWIKYHRTKDSDLLEKAQSSCIRAIEISDRLASVHVTLANIYSQKGQYEDTIEESQKALIIDPVNFSALRKLALAYQKLGREEKAEETFKKIIDLKPTYWQGYFLLGHFYYIRGRNAEAEKMFLQSTELMTEDVRGYNNLIAIYFHLGQNDSALAMFEKSIAIKLNADAYSNMGVIYFMQRRYADALIMYEKAIELGENNYVIWANLADCYRYTPGYSEKAPEAYQRAIQLAEKALETYPRDAWLHSNLAMYYAKSGDYKNALAEVSKARKLAPNDVPLLLDCVLVFEIVNQRDQAIQALQEYIERGGSMEDVRNYPDLSGLRTDPRFKQLEKE